MRPLTILTAVMVSPLFAAPVPKAVLKMKDEEAILGAWKAEAVEGLNPRLLPAEKISETRFYFLEDGLFVFDAPNDWSYGCKFKLDPKAEKKSFHFDRGGGMVFGGLYKLKGDTLTLCWNLKSLETPSELKADGDGIVVWTLNRMKEEKKDK